MIPGKKQPEFQLCTAFWQNKLRLVNLFLNPILLKTKSKIQSKGSTNKFAINTSCNYFYMKKSNTNEHTEQNQCARSIFSELLLFYLPQLHHLEEFPAREELVQWVRPWRWSTEQQEDGKSCWNEFEFQRFCHHFPLFTISQILWKLRVYQHYCPRTWWCISNFAAASQCLEEVFLSF